MNVTALFSKSTLLLIALFLLLATTADAQRRGRLAARYSPAGRHFPFVRRPGAAPGRAVGVEPLAASGLDGGDAGEVASSGNPRPRFFRQRRSQVQRAVRRNRRDLERNFRGVRRDVDSFASEYSPLS